MSLTTSASAPDVSLSRFVSASGTPAHGDRTHDVKVDAARNEATPGLVSATPSFSEAEALGARSPSAQVACQPALLHVSGSAVNTPPTEGRRSTETAGARRAPLFVTVSVYVAVAPSSYACSSDSSFTATSVPHVRQSPRTFFSASCWVAA